MASFVLISHRISRFSPLRNAVRWSATLPDRFLKSDENPRETPQKIQP